MGDLRDQIGTWFSGWKGRPEHDSQLASLEATLRALLDKLDVRGKALGDGVGAHEACRALDSDMAFVERLWRHYKDRLDQRAVDATAAVLRAADEVIWSSYGLARAMAAEPPLPLAYLEPAYTASALPRSKPPDGLRPVDRCFQEVLQQLPVPLVALPTRVAQEPWWLAVLPHEVGHHAQYDLEAKGELVGKVGDLLERRGGAPWQAWRYEVFADAFAVAAIGPVATEVIAEMEWDDLDAMAAPRGGYPPVMLRLALAAEVARALGHPTPPHAAAAWRARLPELASSDARTRMAAGLDAIAAADGRGLAADLAALAIGDSSFAQAGDRATPADVHPDGDDQLAFADCLAGGRRMIGKARRKARFAISAAFRAFQGAASTSDGALRKATLDLVLGLFDPTVKRAVRPHDAAAAELAGSVLAASEAARREEAA